MNSQIRFFPAEQEKYLPLIKEAEEKIYRTVEETGKKLPWGKAQTSKFKECSSIKIQTTVPCVLALSRILALPWRLDFGV